MLEQLFAGVGAFVMVALALRWYIAGEVARQIERRWEGAKARHSGEIERLKQRHALALLATKQAEENRDG
jgi:hypothetical protein